MAEYVYKKIICGTQRVLGKDLERLKAKGWEIAREDMVPRGTASKKFTYVAYLRRVKI